MISISDAAASVARVVNSGSSTTFNRGVGFFMHLASHVIFVSNRHVIYPYDTLTIEIPLIGQTVLASGQYKCIPHKETDVDLAIVIVDRLHNDDPLFWARIERFVLPEACVVPEREMQKLPVLQEISADRKIL